MTPISYWHDSLEPGDTLTPRAALPGDRQVDIAVVGAGFAGLWTAYYLLKANPSFRVVIIDAQTAGFGASGRNGGWCVPEAGSPLDVLDQEGGAGTGAAMLRAMHRINPAVLPNGVPTGPGANAITYGGNNRTHLLRIPAAGRFEVRISDGAANPYLLQAALSRSRSRRPARQSTFAARSSVTPISYWHDSLEPGDTLTPRAALPGDRQVDIAVVGAGFAGLWTAYYLLKANPSFRVVVIDAQTAGFGGRGATAAGVFPKPGPRSMYSTKREAPEPGPRCCARCIVPSTKWAMSRGANRSTAALQKAARCGSPPMRHNCIVCTIASRYSRVTGSMTRISCSTR